MSNVVFTSKTSLKDVSKHFTEYYYYYYYYYGNFTGHGGFRVQTKINYLPCTEPRLPEGITKLLTLTVCDISWRTTRPASQFSQRSKIIVVCSVRGRIVVSPCRLAAAVHVCT